MGSYFTWSTRIKIHDLRYKKEGIGLNFSRFKRNFNTCWSFLGNLTNFSPHLHLHFLFCLLWLPLTLSWLSFCLSSPSHPPPPPPHIQKSCSLGSLLSWALSSLLITDRGSPQIQHIFPFHRQWNQIREVEWLAQSHRARPTPDSDWTQVYNLLP